MHAPIRILSTKWVVYTMGCLHYVILNSEKYSRTSMA